MSSTPTKAMRRASPGNTKKPARTIEVGMSEMAYAPGPHRGEAQQKGPLRDPNMPGRHHEKPCSASHERKCERHPKTKMEEPDIRHAQANNIQAFAEEIGPNSLWKFTHAGTFEYSCLIPGHREAGMIGQVLVK